MQSITITITLSDNEPGYFYDILDDNDNSLDGGLCTGSFVDALEMATDQAKTIINNI